MVALVIAVMLDKEKKMRTCEEEFVSILKETDNIDITRFCNTISYVINSFSIQTKAILDAINSDDTAQNRMNQIAWYWIRSAAYAYKNGNYDERNRISYEKCNRLCDSETGKEVIPLYTNDFNESDFKYCSLNDLDGKRCKEYLVSIYMVREHRTLQQTFTGLIFTYLTEQSSEFRRMTAEIGEDKLGYMIMI